MKKEVFSLETSTKKDAMDDLLSPEKQKGGGLFWNKIPRRFEKSPAKPRKSVMVIEPTNVIKNGDDVPEGTEFSSDGD